MAVVYIFFDFILTPSPAMRFIYSSTEKSPFVLSSYLPPPPTKQPKNNVILSTNYLSIISQLLYIFIEIHLHHLLDHTRKFSKTPNLLFNLIPNACNSIYITPLLSISFYIFIPSSKLTTKCSNFYGNFTVNL